MHKTETCLHGVTPSENCKICKAKKVYNRRTKNRERLLSLIGDKCLICNSTEHLIFHEIHGTPHKNTEPTFYLKNPQNFVTLCYFHHRLVHALMDLNPDAREKIDKLLTSMTM